MVSFIQRDGAPAQRHRGSPSSGICVKQQTAKCTYSMTPSTFCSRRNKPYP